MDRRARYLAAPDDPSFDEIRRMGPAQNLWETRDLMRQWAAQDMRDARDRQQGPVALPQGFGQVMPLVQPMSPLQRLLRALSGGFGR